MRFCGKKGFTLVEIMIVVAIIALLAAIAIPNLLRARHNANETAAIGALRTLASACISYRAVNAAYPTTLGALSGSTPPYIDATLGTGTKQGYIFTAPAGTANIFSVTATPESTGVTGTRIFYVSEDGVIKLTNSAGSPIS
ncbi:MAG: prepilin-type N-terminal cleavage/methylation domain-containing protein [Candidatus Omnitrophota bacterium]